MSKNGNGYSVYIHENKTNGKRYVGLTSRKPEYRWNQGLAYRSNQHFTDAIKKYGWDGFIHTVVKDGLTKEEACELERELIDKYKTTDREFGYNKSIGGECPTLGIVPTPESNEKRRRAMTGRACPENRKIAISKAKRGRPNGLTGRHGRDCMKSGIVIQIDENSGKEVARYFGYYEMNRITGFAQTPVKEVVSGKRKRAYGYLWKYEKRKKDVVI